MKMSRFFYESEAFTGLGFTLIFKRPGGEGKTPRNICCVTSAYKALGWAMLGSSERFDKTLLTLTTHLI